MARRVAALGRPTLPAWPARVTRCPANARHFGPRAPFFKVNTAIL